MEKRDRVFRKETVFEGFFSSFCVESHLSKELEWTGKDKGNVTMRRWFQRYLRDLAEKIRDEDGVSFEDLIPTEVYQRLLQNRGTKFRFRFTVEAEEISV